MAKNDSMDIYPGIQELSVYFVQHYSTNAAPWFILDTDCRYVMHSQTLPVIFKSDCVSFCGKTDEDLNIMSDFYRRRRKKIHTLSIKNKLRIVSLEINLFYRNDVYIPLVYITEPFLFDGKYLSITRIIDVCSLRKFNFISYNKLFNTKRVTDSVLEKPVEYFSLIDPTKVINKSQWDVLWLCLMGYTYRDISEMTGRNLKNTAELLNRAFRNLNVHTLKNFLYIAGLYGWERYIPKTFQKKSLTKILQVQSVKSTYIDL